MFITLSLKVKTVKNTPLKLFLLTFNFSQETIIFSVYQLSVFEDGITAAQPAHLLEILYLLLDALVALPQLHHHGTNRFQEIISVFILVLKIPTKKSAEFFFRALQVLAACLLVFLAAPQHVKPPAREHGTNDGAEDFQEGHRAVRRGFAARTGELAFYTRRRLS